jgi:hypothetical protein
MRGRLFFLLFWLFAPSAGAETTLERENAAAEYGERFADIVKRAASRVEETAARRPFRLKSVNDSFHKTVLAARAMAVGEPDTERIRGLLREARSTYDENSFAILLQGILLNARRGPEQANPFFEEFLQKSRRYTEVERPFLEWEEFHTLRVFVYHLLVARGITPQGGEALLRSHLPQPSLMEYLLRTSLFDRVVAVGFLILLIGGGAATVVYGLYGGDLSKPAPAGWLGFYIAGWIAYGAWLLDIAVGLPWGLSRFTTVPAFLAAVAFCMLAMAFLASRGKKEGPLEPGLRSCPHCGGAMPELMLECPHCRQRI